MALVLSMPKVAFGARNSLVYVANDTSHIVLHIVYNEALGMG